MKLYNKKNHFSPRNIEKYNNLYRNTQTFNYVLFHLELLQCLYLKKEMQKDYLNYDVVMKRLQEQYDFHKQRMKSMF